MQSPKQITLALPLYVWASKKNKFILNLNNYRNTHFRTLAKAKLVYSERVKEIVKKSGLNGTIFDCCVSLTYTHYAQTKRKYDVSNPCSIIDKFTCDSLTELGFWPDDDIRSVAEVQYKAGSPDRINPRCELTIRAL